MNEKVIQLLLNLTSILNTVSYNVTGAEMTSVQNERVQLAFLLAQLQEGAFVVSETASADANSPGAEASDLGAPEVTPESGDISGDGVEDTGVPAGDGESD
jgi:hypothetical protein